VQNMPEITIEQLNAAEQYLRGAYAGKPLLLLDLEQNIEASGMGSIVSAAMAVFKEDGRNSEEVWKIFLVHTLALGIIAGMKMGGPNEA